MNADMMNADLANENLLEDEVEKLQRLVEEMRQVTTPMDKNSNAKLRSLLFKLNRAQEQYGIAVRKHYGIG